MTEEEIQARVKARLKEEGIGDDEPAPAPVVRHARPPAHIDSSEVNPLAENVQSNVETAPTEDSTKDTFDALDQAAKELEAEKNKKNKDESTSQKEIAAGAGAAAGVAYQLNKKPGESVFRPQPTEQNINTINEINAEIAKRQSSIAKIEDQLRAITQNPNVKITDFTPDQVQRILQGGEGATLGTTGAQRSYGFNEEQQRIARHLQETERNVRAMNPNLPDPIVEAGQMVPLPGSNIRVPSSVATKIAQEKIQNQAQQQKANLQRQIESEQNKINIGQANINKEMNLAKSRGYRAGAGKVGMSALGGALTGLDALDVYRIYQANKENPTQNRPLDWTDYLRLGGGPLAMFGRGVVAPIGLGMQIPYAVKHSKEVAGGMTMGDINPTAFGGKDALEPAFPEYRR